MQSPRSCWPSFAGAALGAAAVQGLHAQAKLKAYSVGEVELIGAFPSDYLPNVRKASPAIHVLFLLFKKEDADAGYMTGYVSGGTRPSVLARRPR